MTLPGTQNTKYEIKTTSNLSPRVQRLRDFFFQGVHRAWNNEFKPWTTGTAWDFQYHEFTYYIVPETYFYLPTFKSSFKQIAKTVNLHPDFWHWSLPERRAWFVKEVMTKYLPMELLPGDLLAGARFNIQTSTCLNKKEARTYEKLVLGRNGTRATMLWFHNHGFGNTGATSGHVVPDYASVLVKGWKGIHAEIERAYLDLEEKEKMGRRGAQLRAMMMAASMPREVAAGYSRLCSEQAAAEKDPVRRWELQQLGEMLMRIPWDPPRTFWEAVQALWLTHMLVMADENYPGPGTSFGRMDQYLYPFWKASLQQGMDREFGKEIMKCFWVHCNTAYDALIRTGGNQGITAGYGQLLTISGLGLNGEDLTNDLTYAILEVIDEMSPILEPKPNVRLHRGSPDKLLDKIVDMISTSQGAPFLLNFDERSMAGMMLEGRKAGMERSIHKGNVFDYAPVGCLENTMVGNDRSGTVDDNLNLLKAVELAMADGYELLPFTDALTGKVEKLTRLGPRTGDAGNLSTWEEFWKAYVRQTKYIIKKSVDTYEKSEALRARFFPTPYLSCLVHGCKEKGMDINEGGAELNFVTIEGVTYATTVDSLLAIKYLVYDKQECTLPVLVQALKDNWVGHEVLQAKALNKAPKYGRDDEEADRLAKEVMAVWCDETWNHKTVATGRRFRPGMLSWNYWIAYSDILPASADGRKKGKFLSNAICPSNGADINGPTANVNSVGKVMGGKARDGKGDWLEYFNMLPNGCSHTITFNPSLLKDREHKAKFKAFLRGYVENGGSALQVNMLDAAMLRDAQKHPREYRHLLVRVTGYNAYFTAIGKELQDEIIARESHRL
jgi:pyruvate-formate lyase